MKRDGYEIWMYGHATDTYVPDHFLPPSKDPMFTDLGLYYPPPPPKPKPPYMEWLVKIGLIASIIGVMWLISSRIVGEERCGVIKEKFVTSTRYGEPRYYIIVHTEDGYIQTMQGFKYYTTTVGSRVCWTTYKLK